MRQRLRKKWSDEELEKIYSKPHDHKKWRDHIIRVNTTKQVAGWIFEGSSVADLSCGNAEIARSVGADHVYLGDIAPGYQFQGPIERMIEELPKPVDLFICSETLEHLDDPDKVLGQIRNKTDRLLISTPVDNWNDPNLEHYWAWSKADVEVMLRLAGFTPEVCVIIDLPNYLYNYQIWGCY